MKMSESWLSCSISCGTSRFGLLWGRSRRVWVPAGHSAPFFGVVKTAFAVQMRIATWFSDLPAGGTGNTHRRHAETLSLELGQKLGRGKSFASSCHYLL